MLVSEQAVDAMQAYLRSKRYILPSGIARAALTAAAPFLQGVKVKALEWTKGVVDMAQPHPGMKYVACSTTPVGSWAWWLEGALGSRGVFPSEEAAKAAAQADYEARILSTIEPAPSTREHALEEALRNLLHAVCGETGFANAVRQVSGLPWPWPSLDIAETAAIRALSSQPVADEWLPVTTGLNAIGYEIGGGYILKLSYDNLSQFEAAHKSITSHLPASPGASATRPTGGSNHGE